MILIGPLNSKRGWLIATLKKKIEHVIFLSASKATVEFDAACFQSHVHTRHFGLFNEIAFNVQRRLNSVNAP